MASRRRQEGSLDDIEDDGIPEPRFIRLEALHNRVTGLGCMVAGMLGRRRIAAADVTAMAPPEMEPPATGCETLRAARATGSGRDVEGRPIDHAAHHPSNAGAAVRPFRFLVGARGLQDRRTLVERARAAEATGYSDVTVHDHLAPQLAPIALLTAVAMATDRLRLCPLVFNNDLRHPAVLAQELATLDVLSEGRLVVGIGAGWHEPEYRAIALPFDPPPVRISRMLEAITILRGLFGEGPTSFHGRFYNVTNLDGQPKPVQRPHPPFLIGGTRERVLRIAAREADIVGMDLRQDRESLGDAFPARMDERVRWVRDEAGGRFGELELSCLRLLGGIAITNEPLKVAAEVARGLEARTGLSIEPRDVLESPYSLIGSVPDLVAKLRAGRERWGINSMLVGWFDEPELRDFAPVVEQLAGT
jgi:probable F420-dependent oxidoreductase